jgi:translocation and assembly module TamB
MPKRDIRHNSTEDAGLPPDAKSRPWPRRLARAIFRLTLAVLTIIILMLLLLEVDSVVDSGGRWALRKYNPFINAELDFREASGGVLSGLQVRDVSLHDDSGDTLVSVVRLSGKIGLWRLLRGEVALSDVDIERPRIVMTQLPDSSWNLINVLPADTTGESTPLSIQGLTLLSGTARASFYNRDRDSTLRVHDLNLVLRNLRSPATSFDIDSARVRFSPPGASDTVRAFLSGTLKDRALDLVRLELTSSVSDLKASGRVAFTGRDQDFRDLDFSLAAAPLGFRDIQAFLPVLNPDAHLNADLQIDGSSDLLDISGDFTFGDGATVVLRGNASPPSASALAYRLTARVDAVDPNYVLRSNEPAQSRLTADVDVDLNGTSKDDLSGYIRMDMGPFRYGTFEISPAIVNAKLVRGELDVQAAGTVNGSRLSVNGSGRPLDDAPAYRAAVTVSGLNVARFGSARDKSDLNGRMTLDVQGQDLTSMNGSARLTLLPSTWNSVPVSSAATSATIRDGVIRVATAGSVGDGRFDGTGRIALDPRITVVIDRLAVQKIDVAALSSDTTASSVSGIVRGTLEGRDLDTARGAITLSLDTTSYGAYKVISGTTSLRMASGQVTGTAALNMRGGLIELEGTVRPFGRSQTYQIARARFDSVNYAALTGTDAWQTNLSGTISGRATVTGGSATGQAAVRLDTSRVNQQIVESADIEATLTAGLMSVTLEALTPDGLVSLNAKGRPLDEIPNVSISDGRFAGIELSRILGTSSLHTNLNGSFNAQLRNFDMESMMATGQLDVEESIINSDTIRVGTVVFAADSGNVNVQSAVELVGGQALVNGSIEVAGDRRFDVEGSIAGMSPTRLAGMDSLESDVSMEFAFSGSGLAGPRPNGRGRLKVGRSRIGDVSVDEARSVFSLQAGVLNLDTLSIQSNVATVSGSGGLVVDGDSTSPDSDLRLRAVVTDLSPLQSIIPDVNQVLADGDVDITVSGAAGETRVRVDGQLHRVAYGNLRVGEIRVRLVGRLESDLRFVDAEGRLEAVQASLPNVAARTARVDVAYREDELHFEGLAVVDDRTDARMAGHITLGTDAPVLTLESLRLGPTNQRWELLTTSTVTLGDEYRISNFLMYAGDQQVAVDGYVDLDGEQSLIVSIESFRIGAVTELFGYQGLGGRISGFIDLTGRADAPQVRGSLTADVTALRKRVGDLSVDLDYSDLRLQVNALLRDDDGKTLALDGYVPIDLRLSVQTDEAGRIAAGTSKLRAQGESALTIQADGFAIGWIKPFLDPTLFSDIGGRLTGRVGIGGTFADPTLNGSATVSNGLLRLTQFGVTYADIQVESRFEDDLIQLDRVTATSGRGSLIATGSISLKELTLGDFDINISTEDFLAVENREYRAVAGAKLVLAGTTRRPTLTGTVDVASADIFFVKELEEFEPVELSMQDLLTVEQRFGIRLTERDTTTFDFYRALSMDLTVKISRDTWIRSKKNPTMDIQFTGNLEVSKRPNQDEQAFGSIEVLPERSRIVQFGKSFALKKGNLTYNGSMEDPVLDIEAAYAIRAWRNPENEVTITLAATGKLDDLDVELSSDPTMELTDIVSYIAFGRPASESLHLGGAGSGGSLATDIALGQVAGLIEGVAGSGLGLDVVEIEQQGLDTRLTAGKYVHSKLYLSISQPISLGGSTSGSTFGNKREITAEFELIESLLLRLLTKRGSISVNLLWQYAY